MRLAHEGREVVVSVLVATCLMFGIGSIVVALLGPDGWLLDLLRSILHTPSLSGLTGLASVILGAYTVKHLLDRGSRSTGLNNLLVGVVAVVGFIFLLESIHVAFF